MALGHACRRAIAAAVPTQAAFVHALGRLLTGADPAALVHFPLEALAELKHAVRRSLAPILGPLPAEARGIIPGFIEAYNTLTGDPDCDLPPWLVTGAPLGILRPITSRGVFPQVPGLPLATPTGGKTIAPPRVTLRCAPPSS